MTRRDSTRREIAEGLHLLQGCVVPEEVQGRIDAMDESPSWYDSTGEVHAQFNAYLFDGEASLLFDTLPPDLRTGEVGPVVSPDDPTGGAFGPTGRCRDAHRLLDLVAGGLPLYEVR